MNYLKKNFVVIFIFILSLILVSIWFKDRNILGTAEDGLIFYNISHYYHQTEYTWMEYPGLGSPALTLIVGKPTFFLLSYLQDVGIEGFLIQAGVLWFILMSSGVGIYLFVKELFPKLDEKYVLLSIIFYWFNPITLFDVWNRFLLNYTFFFALLPIATIFYIKGLKDGKFIWSLIFNIFLLFYSYAFSYVAFIILFWIWLLLLTLYFAAVNKISYLRFFYIKYFSLTVLLFILVNCWWILPLFKLYLSGGLSPTRNLFANQDNIGILNALSNSIGNLTDIFRLTNASFLSTDSLSWVKLFYSPFIQLLMYIIVGVILYTFIKLRKDPSVLFLASFFFLLIFLVKGSNPPFGEIYTFVFKHIIVLQIFRNSFEKYGFLLSLIASGLIAISIFNLTSNIKNKFGKFIYPSFFIAIFFILGFPMYSSLIFTNKFPPTDNYFIGYKVEVPSYYKQMNSYLDREGNNFRIIGFPIKDEGITYLWNKGYAGVELAVALYDSKGIFHNTSTPFFNQIVPVVEDTLLLDSDFSRLANLVNARFYILRNDIDYQLRNMTDPSVIEKKLAEKEKRGEVKKVASFGKVSIWENLKWKDNTFYFAKKITTDEFFDSFEEFSAINLLEGDVLIEENNLSEIEKIVASKLSDKHPIIYYKKINPTKYTLYLENISTPTLLVFSELYNGGWRATYLEGEVLSKHIRTNVYANSWVVDRKGNSSLVIEFEPQNWMDMGEKISYISVIFLVFLIIYLIKLKREYIK